MKKRAVFIVLMLCSLGLAVAAAAAVGIYQNRYDSDKYLKTADIFSFGSAEYTLSDRLPERVSYIAGSDSSQLNSAVKQAAVSDGALILCLDNIESAGFYEEFVRSGSADLDSFMLYKKASVISRARKKYTGRTVGVYTQDERFAALCRQYSVCEVIFTGECAYEGKFCEAVPAAPDRMTADENSGIYWYAERSDGVTLTVGDDVLSLRECSFNCVPESVVRYELPIDNMPENGEYGAEIAGEPLRLTVAMTQRQPRTAATVVTDSAEPIVSTEDGGKYRPDLSPLPEGVQDYCTVDGDICILESGARLYLSTDSKGDIVSISEAVLPDDSVAAVTDCTLTARGDTQITVRRGCYAPFELSMIGQTYKDLSKTDPRPDGTVEAPEMTAVKIRFCGAAAALGTVQLPENGVFRDAQWKRENGEYSLLLTLSESGAFYGWHAEYNDDGELIFTFNEPPELTAAENEYGCTLENAVIILDAGHGGEDPGAVSADGSLLESDLNLSLAKRVRAELESLGAQVIMTRSGNDSVSLEQRAAIARESLPDLFISIHRNASENEAAVGYYDYYYTPYSKPPADCIFSAASQLFEPQKTEYYPFFVTRITECPSVLTENGFISNSAEAQKISGNEFDDLLAEKTAAGIVNYLKSICNVK